MMIIDEKFNMGDIVYLKTDVDQKPRMVTGYKIKPNSELLYCLSCAEDETMHYLMEITIEKDLLVSI